MNQTTSSVVVEFDAVGITEKFSERYSTDITIIIAADQLPDGSYGLLTTIISKQLYHVTIDPDQHDQLALLTHIAQTLAHELRHIEQDIECLFEADKRACARAIKQCDAATTTGLILIVALCFYSQRYVAFGLQGLIALLAAFIHTATNRRVRQILNDSEAETDAEQAAVRTWMEWSTYISIGEP